MKKQWKEFVFFVVNIFLMLVIKIVRGDYSFSADEFASGVLDITAWLMAISVVYILFLIKAYRMAMITTKFLHLQE